MAAKPNGGYYKLLYSDQYIAGLDNGVNLSASG
jgi:hypothetical protein